jgi:hypothetical protein
MKLQEAQLCIDCETIYSQASRCPLCGSRVSYPLGRALDRRAAPATQLRSRPPLELVGQELGLRQTA